MYGRRGLGFISPVVVVVVVIVVVVVRWKWRQWVERSEEVRRLLVSASEEASRVEFEAREARYYSGGVTPLVTVPGPVSVPVQSYGAVKSGSVVKPVYQCAVCFRPTTTRCAKCKAVRYWRCLAIFATLWENVGKKRLLGDCGIALLERVGALRALIREFQDVLNSFSGKCQIVHWRQGHKEECRPYVAVTQLNVGGSSKRQGVHNDHSDSFDTEAKQTSTPAESKSPLSYERPSVFSMPTNFSAGVTFENLETVKAAHVTPVSPTIKSTGLWDNNQRTSIPSDEDTRSGTSSSSFWTDDGSNNQKTSVFSDEDTQSGTSNSSYWTDDGSNKSSSPYEPSTNSFGFLDTNIPNRKSSISEHDNFVPASVGEAEHGLLANHTAKVISNSNIKDGFPAVKGMDGSGGSKKSDHITDNFAPASVGEAEQGQLANHTAKVISNSNIKDGFPAVKAMDGSGLGSKKSNHITDLPKGMVNHVSNSSRPSTSTSGMLNHRDRSVESDLATSKLRDSKYSLSDAPLHHASTAARYSEVPEKSADIFCNKSTGPDMSKSRDIVSSSTRASDAYSTTVIGRNISHSKKPMKVVDDDNHRIATCSSQLTEDSKFRESKNSLSDVSSHHTSTVARYSKVSEKSNDVFCNKSTPPDVCKSRDAVSSSPRASDTYLTTVTSRNISHSTKPVNVVDDVSHRSTTSSKLTEAFRSGSKTSKSKVVDYLKSSKLSRQESLEGGSNTTHTYSFKGLFPYEMFVKLYNWKQVELQPCGLKNCGNSCYANAVLQCLIYTPPLAAYLLEGLHSKACEKSGWCFTCEFEGLVRKAKDGISPLSPIRILTHIENVGSNLGHGKEEDAHEFLRYVIDALQSVCIKESRKKSLNSLEEETTLIGLTFGGYLRSKIVCMKCGGKSEQPERMMDLTVEIEGDVRTLEEALDKFTSTEILDGENKYKCNRCKSYEKAKKKFTLLEAPNVLTIALKRFQSGKFGKLNKSIHFPEILDMAPYVSGTSDKSPIYSLYGVVVHVDTMNATFSGHYVSYVKNFQNRWFKFDDSMVKEVDLQHVLTKGAYMLLYARCSPRAPRSIRSSIIHHHHHHDDPRKQKIPPSFVSKPHSIAPWEVCGYHPPRVHHRSLEEESFSSDNSGFFSESCSCSTESTHRDLSSIEDHIYADWEPDYHKNITLNSSDSDTSSSSSFPSPLYSRLSQLYSSSTNAEEDHKVSNVCRNLGCSCNSCRITNFDRLGGRATYLASKPSVTMRRPTTRGKSD
ncbi:hypothetical protein M8C21_021323 [Ambrosia artemisiifolia]|uniref:USP domain-containing protein n=1 Tax=Ambrosia artemisiifolia TaxID=4212 RepID=A0AAD5G8R4_AMBAR|nr:hypothetical protein M8C21_021323 [Ambrosia artemisiifolia]